MQKGELNDIIQKLDEDIAHYSKLGTNARLERNSYMLVCQLPTEILCRIFLFTRDACILSSRYSNRRDMAWISAVSHVCHHWRCTALHEVRLWVDPPLENFQWSKTMLKRSKKARLSIKLNIGWGPRGVYIPVFDHLPHIGKLSIHKSSSVHLEHILGYLEGIPAPMLESLCICCGDVHPTTPTFQLPANVLLETPKLRHLCLSNIPTDLTSPIFSSSLTTLKLKDLRFGSNPTFLQLWALLERLPELEVLVLTWAVLPDLQLHSDEVQVARRRQPISLPKVTKVELTGQQPYLQFLVDNISLSRDIKSIYVMIVHEHTSTLGRLVNDTSNAFSTAFSPHTVSIRRKNRQSPLFFIISTVASGDSSLPRTLEVSVRRFNLFAPQSDPLSDAEIDVGFTELFTSFRWPNLAVLVLNGLAGDSLPCVDTLAETFGSLPSISVVSVDRQTASLLVETLRCGLEPALDDLEPCLEAQTPPSQRRIIFPGLWGIKMSSVEFLMGNEAEEVDEQSVNYHNFTDCLRNRRKRGVPIRVMEMVDCESGSLDSRALKDVMLPSLQENVDDIDWVVSELCVELTDSEEESDDCL